MIHISHYSKADEQIKNSGSIPTESKIVVKNNYSYPFVNYEAYIEFMKASPAWTEDVLRKSFPQSLYESCVNPKKMEFLELNYQGPNGHTRGWMMRPVITNNKLPVVVFNRGGFAKWGRIFPYELIALCNVAIQGFAVVASDFRAKNGIDIPGNKDTTDLGYGDVNDNFYLLDAVKKEYPDLDIKNLIVWGFSRGTTLNALMITRSEDVKLVIMQGMVTDLVDNSRRDEFDEHVYPLLVENYLQLSRSEQNKLLSGISPIRLIDQIKGKPKFLIFHGAKDKRTSANGALLYANELLKKNFTVELHLYPESGHVLSENFYEFINQVIDALKDIFPIK